MDECQLYSALLHLEPPWKVSSVSLDPMKKVVEIYITHEKGSKLLCPICRKESMVYDHLLIVFILFYNSILIMF